MTTEAEYEETRSATPEEAAAVLSAVADGLLTGSIRLGEGEEALAVDVPDELDLEVEFEREGDELSLELEFEWPAPEGEGRIEPSEAADASGTVEGTEAADASGTVEGTEGGDASATVEGTEAGDDDGSAANSEADVEPAIPVAAADATQSLARFEVYRDRGDEWRWRLRHRNGNIIATSGEGYSRKHNAWKGLRSVMANAPEAAVRESGGE